MGSLTGVASAGNVTDVSSNLPDWSPSSIVPFRWVWKPADEKSGIRHYQLSSAGLEDMGSQELQSSSNESTVNSNSPCTTPAADNGPNVQMSICQVNSREEQQEEPLISCSREILDRTSHHFGFPLELFEQFQSRDGEVSMIHVTEHDAQRTDSSDLEETTSCIINVAFVDAFWADLWCICIPRHNVRTGAAAILLVLDPSGNAALHQQMQILSNDILVNPLTLLRILQKRSLLEKSLQVRGQTARDVVHGVLRRLDVVREDDEFVQHYHLPKEAEKYYSKLNAELLAWAYHLREREGYLQNHGQISKRLRNVNKVFEKTQQGSLISNPNSNPNVQHSASWLAYIKLDERLDNLIENCAFQKNHHQVLVSVIQAQFSVLFNKISQRDSHLNFLMAGSSRDVAEATRTDGTYMKTIAIVTLVFLPATFVSAVFSTTFFQGSSHLWRIYLMVCVVLTLITLALWTGYMRRWNKKEMQRRKTSDDIEKRMDKFE